MVGNAVTLIECPRDAWQGLSRQIPTELKARYLRTLVDIGFKHIDAVSFVSPKTVPQMADSEKVLEQLDLPDDVEIIGIVVNEKGAERAIATQAVSTLGFPCSISETFLRKNQNQTLDECYKVLESIKRKADGAGLSTVVYISMAFGNPYGDPWDAKNIREALNRLVGMGIQSVSLADTVGMAGPDLIRNVFGSMTSGFAACDIGAHLHSAPAQAESKILAAYDAGCRRFDSAIGGLGGCPFAQDALVGNIPTERLLAALKQRGVEQSIGSVLPDVVILNSLIAADYS
ncbi:MAG TPA: hydroxymethylglutaryl-CoA lyase [Candidatus Babeliales bacterium]|nr:hydroxymethylglutaryl-CoA lyase [Candidatus Babeliales bacterium]